MTMGIISKTKKLLFESQVKIMLIIILKITPVQKQFKENCLKKSFRLEGL